MRRRSWDEKGERRFRLILLAVLILALASIHLIAPGFYPTIWELTKNRDLEGLILYLQSFGIWAVFVSFFIDVVINIVGFLPSIFISTANGLIFGLFWGTIISWLAETTGVVISFWAMRVLFRTMAMHLIEKSKTLSKLDQYESWQAVAVARAIPYMPNGLVTAVSALSSMPFERHLLGSLIGKLPSVALEVCVGHDVVRMGQHAERLTVIILVVAVIYGFIWWRTKKKKKAASDGETK